MSALEPCGLHDVSNCSVCTGLDAATRREERGGLQRLAPIGPGYVAAQWPGRCADCGEWFEAGDAIRYSDDAEGWVGECCG